jgi:ATP-dependent Lon protease
MIGIPRQDKSRRVLVCTAPAHRRAVPHSGSRSGLTAKVYIDCPVMILRDIVVFPRMISPVFMSRPDPICWLFRKRNLIFRPSSHWCSATRILKSRSPKIFSQLEWKWAVGRLLSMPEGNNSALVQGRRRVEVVEFTQVNPSTGPRAARSTNRPTSTARWMP